MYNDDFAKTIIDDLEKKKVTLIQKNITLSSLGYIVDNNNHFQVSLNAMLIDAFENILLFKDKQQRKLEHLFNIASTL